MGYQFVVRALTGKGDQKGFTNFSGGGAYLFLQRPVAVGLLSQGKIKRRIKRRKEIQTGKEMKHMWDLRLRTNFAPSRGHYAS